jgi:hypothetical protein
VGARYATQAIGFQASAGYPGAAVIPAIVGVVATSHGVDMVGLSLLITAIALLGLHKVAVLADMRSRVAPAAQIGWRRA